MFPNQPALYRPGLAQGPPQAPPVTPSFANRMPPNVMSKVMGGQPQGGGRQGRPMPPPPNLIQQQQQGQVGGGEVEPQQIIDMYEMAGDFMGSSGGESGLNYGETTQGMMDSGMVPPDGMASGGGAESGMFGDMFSGAPGGMTGMGLGIGGGLLSSQGQGGSMFGGWFDGDKGNTEETWAGIGGGAMQGFSMGGPWGALAGGILGAVGAWT